MNPPGPAWPQNPNPFDRASGQSPSPPKWGAPPEPPKPKHTKRNKAVKKPKRPRSEQGSEVRNIVIVAIVLSLVAIALTYYLSVSRWFGDGVPLMILGASAPIVGLLTALLTNVSEGAVEAKQLIKPFAIGAVIAAAFGVPSGMAWQSEGVRKNFLDIASKQGMWAALEKAVEDKNQALAAHACKTMLVSPELSARKAAVDAISTRPLVAGECLVTKDPKKKKDNMATADHLINRWYKDLARYQGSNTEHACLNARAIASVHQSSPHTASVLLVCSLTSPNQAVRQCCAEAMEKVGVKGARLEQDLVQTTDHTKDLEYVSPLLAASWHQLSLKGTDKQMAQSLELPSKSMQRYSMNKACQEIDNEDLRDELAEEFHAISMKKCSGDTKAFKNDSTFWSGVCEELIEKDLYKAKDAKEMFCAQVEKKLFDGAVAEASQRIRIATIIRQNPKAIDSIHRAHVLRSLTLEGFASKLAGLDGQGVGMSSPYQSGGFRDIAFEIQQEIAEYEMNRVKVKYDDPKTLGAEINSEFIEQQIESAEHMDGLTAEEKANIRKMVKIHNKNTRKHKKGVRSLKKAMREMRNELNKQ